MELTTQSRNTTGSPAARGARRFRGSGCATFALADAERFGFKVRTGEGEETVIGYDRKTQELYVDRTRSGAVDFHRAPLTASNSSRKAARPAWAAPPSGSAAVPQQAA
ncbi:GH32 C-terminal domain-containing protein [Streptomyces sp. NPDC059202]|uniref:GH32 C-terminal domain-containing protein n=1 Tax=unclassified Streptomyces TaxID=2593676 RepID=UPI00365FE354